MHGMLICIVFATCFGLLNNIWDYTRYGKPFGTDISCISPNSKIDCCASPSITGMGILALISPMHRVSMITSCQDVVPGLPIAS